MSFKELNIKLSYRSKGDKNISDIINPLLNDAIVYKRSVGFFSSTVLDIISEGIKGLVKNNGIIKLITSPELSKEDIEAISEGYEAKTIIEKNFISQFELSLENIELDNLDIITDLISNDILNIKIVLNKNRYGMYHDKLAVLEDKYNNKVVFTGSSNESESGYYHNYEKIRVFKSWEDPERVVDEEQEFDDIWENNNEFLDTYNFMDAIKESIIKVSTQRHEPQDTKSDDEPYKLFDYQKEAVKAWVDNDYKGFYVMATGTGKTVTSLYALKELLTKEDDVTIIAVPYKHLVAQWEEDVVKIFPKSRVFKVSSEFPKWDTNISNALLNKKYNNDDSRIIIITTISSFCTVRFAEVNKYIANKKILIVDEAHNFLNKIYKQEFNIYFDYKLGLSATPVFGKDEQKTKDLLNYFGGLIYSLPIEKAIGKFLVNYEYYPIYVNATEYDENRFIYFTKQMAQCFDKNGKMIDEDLFTKAYRGRLRTISMAEGKINNLSDIIDSINFDDHFIIYCSDGKIYDDDGSSIGIRHLQMVVNLLNDKGFTPSQFTASETMDDRMRLIKNFNEGDIDTLVAIRCLDEGINIPSIKTALILSSNDNYREFVQRRGRILRKYHGKEKAKIFDIILKPSYGCPDIAKIELRRFNEYAKLALNKDELLAKLDRLLDEYNLDYSDIEFGNEFIDGGEFDE